MNKELIKARSEKEYWLAALNTLIEMVVYQKRDKEIDKYKNAVADKIASIVRELSGELFTLEWIKDNYPIEDILINSTTMKKWEGRYDNPAMKKITMTSDEINNTMIPDTKENNNNTRKTWEWTDDKVIEFTQYVLSTYKKSNEWTEDGTAERVCLKEWKIKDMIGGWMDKVGYDETLFLNDDEELTMTSGELKQLINLLRNHS